MDNNVSTLNLKDGLPLLMDTLHPTCSSDESRAGYDESQKSSVASSRRASQLDDGELLNPDFSSGRKHSSGDLHSRLKTRKLLGVGETDDGDVHRSKLSQILGHSDQLYVKLPPGLRVWQLILAIMFTLLAVWALAFPSHLFDITFESDEGKYLSLPVRLYGTALLSLSLVYWGTLQCSDRGIIRMALLSSILYFALQILVTGFDILFSQTQSTKVSNFLMGYHMLSAIISFVYYYLVGDKLVSIRRTPSMKEQQNGEKKQG